MKLSFVQAVIMIAVAVICTFITRVIPFLLFGGNKKMPKQVEFLGNVLPPAIIATLVIYCLKSVNLFKFPNGLPEFIAIGVVAVLHIWKRNILLSMAGGTICYMILIQTIFA